MYATLIMYIVKSEDSVQAVRCVDWLLAEYGLLYIVLLPGRIFDLIVRLWWLEVIVVIGNTMPSPLYSVSNQHYGVLIVQL